MADTLLRVEGMKKFFHVRRGFPITQTVTVRAVYRGAVRLAGILDEPETVVVGDLPQLCHAGNSPV